MTELFIVFASVMGSFLLTDPFFEGALTRLAPAKVTMLFLGFGTLTFHLLGRAVVAPQRLTTAVGEVVRTWWPALLLALFVVCGGAYARAVSDIHESFLAMGLGLLFGPLWALTVRAADKPFVLLKAMVVIYALTVLVMLGYLIADDHVFHEVIFVAVPAGLYWLFAPKFSWWRTLLGLTLIGLCVLSFKNTTFLIMLAAVFAYAAVWLPRIIQDKRAIGLVLTLLVTTVGITAAAAALGFSWWTFRDLLPSGSTEYRQEMYAIAWQRFLDSPVWGTAFTGSSVQHFTLYKINQPTQYLPTHSDVLDILANGGVIAAVLWLALVWIWMRMSLHTWRVLVKREHGVDLRPWQWMGVLALIQFGALITYAFNPILISPVHAYWVWGSAGLMWALYRILTAAPLPQALPDQAQRQQAPPG